MNFQITDIIRKKSRGETLSEGELRFTLEGYLSGQHKDYHLSAFLMAVFQRGMEQEELRKWTRLMWHSGITFPRKARTNFWIDKHSTGGVGDKTSILLVPLVHAVCERLLGEGAVRIPMVSGRGLDFTGGTLDKLESVPGFSTQADVSRAMGLLERNGYFIVGQSADIAPADRMLYALRDVTATVESEPLMISSILSKKLAENLDGLILDVKFGAGAFAPDLGAARALGEKLAAVARSEGVQATALLTPMDQPLGWKVGNQLEIEECDDFLSGEAREAGLTEVTLTLAAEMVSMASRGTISVDAAREECEAELCGRKAHEIFGRMFHEQGGDFAAFRARRKVLENRLSLAVPAPSEGYLAKLDARWFGMLVRALGGGRESKESKIDPDVGVVFHKKLGDFVKRGETLFEVFYGSPERRERIPANVGEAFSVDPKPVSVRPWVAEVIRAR